MILYLTETELTDNIHAILARIRDEGLEVIVERDHRPPHEPWVRHKHEESE